MSSLSSSCCFAETGLSIFFHKILLMVKEQLMNLFVLQQSRQNDDFIIYEHLAVVTQVMF